jgi:hypothetical protein
VRLCLPKKRRTYANNYVIGEGQSAGWDFVGEFFTAFVTHPQHDEKQGDDDRVRTVLAWIVGSRSTHAEVFRTE